MPAAHTAQDPEVPVEPVAQVTGALELPPSDWQSETAVAPMPVIFPEGQVVQSLWAVPALYLPASHLRRRMWQNKIRVEIMGES